MTPETGALKPCPFCGGFDLIISQIDYPYITCNSCDGAGPYLPTEAEAVAAWNKRAVEDVLVEALEKLMAGIKHLCDVHKLSLKNISSYRQAQSALKLAKGE